MSPTISTDTDGLCRTSAQSADRRTTLATAPMQPASGPWHVVDVLSTRAPSPDQRRTDLHTARMVDGVMAGPPPGYCADHIVLCAHGQSSASAVRVLTVDAARAGMSARAWRLLGDPLFELRPVDGYPAPLFGTRVEPFAVLTETACGLVVRHDDDLVFSPSRQHQRALAELRQVWAEHSTPFPLRGNGCVVLDAHSVFTERSAPARSVIRTLVCVPEAESAFGAAPSCQRG